MSQAAEYKNLEVYPRGSSLNVRQKPGTASAIVATVAAGQLAGKTTGNYLSMEDGKWYQLQLANKTLGYVREDVAAIIKANTVTVADAKGMINNLVESDKKVFESLLRIAPLLSVAKQKGVETSIYEKQFKTLTDRLAARQDTIKKSSVIKWQTGIKKGYDSMMTWFKDLYAKISGIGVIPLVAIVVSAVAGAGLAAGAYFIFKPKYSESQVDLKISSDLESLLKKTDPVTAKKITDNLEKQVDKAYNQGTTDEKFSGMFAILKPLAIALAGFFLITRLISSQNKKK
jgi:hypothetical protein